VYGRFIRAAAAAELLCLLHDAQLAPGGLPPVSQPPLTGWRFCCWICDASSGPGKLSDQHAKCLCSSDAFWQPPLDGTRKIEIRQSHHTSLNAIRNAMNISEIGLLSMSLQVLTQVSHVSCIALPIMFHSHMMVASSPRGRRGI